MKTLTRLVTLTSFALLLGLAAHPASAQDRQGGRGNFDPEQFRQRMMERYREQMDVKSDDEWKVLETRIEKVMEARRAAGGMGGPGGFGFGGRGGGQRRGGDNADAGAGGGAPPRPRGGAEQSPEVEALQKAMEAKAPNDEIKAKLGKVREARKAKEAKLAEAQEELRKVLSVRQEASAVMAGLLP